MSIAGAILCVSTMVVLMGKTLVFHQGTVCRQKYWLKSVEKQTGQLLHSTLPHLPLVRGCPWKNQKIHLSLKGKL